MASVGSIPTGGNFSFLFFNYFYTPTPFLNISSMSYTLSLLRYTYTPPSNLLSISLLSLACVSQYFPFFAFLLHLPPFFFSSNTYYFRLTKSVNHLTQLLYPHFHVDGFLMECLEHLHLLPAVYPPLFQSFLL